MKLLGLKNIPLTIVIGFNLFTLFIFYTAPFHWATDNLLLFFVFAFACQIMIALGYKIGFKKSLKISNSKKILNTFPRKKLNFVFIFYGATFLIKYAYLLRINLFDVKGMISILMIGIMNPQMGYALSLNESGATTISWSVFFLISIINQFFFIIGFIKWREMSKGKKILLAVFIFIDLFYWMGRGTNFGVISLFSTLGFASLYKLRDLQLNLKTIFRLYLIIIVLLVGSLYTFSYNMTKRSGSNKLDLQVFNLGLSKVDENSTIFKILPEELQPTYMYMVSYMAQGYYHTCLAFDLDFKPTFFLANNPALIDFAKFFYKDVWKDTYVYRLKDKGVDPLVNWHSAYLWYASDFSFPGVPIILFFLGYILGCSWGLGLTKNDFLSKIVFIISANMLLFLFANNSYLSSVFYSFMFILPLWYFNRVQRIRF